MNFQRFRLSLPLLFAAHASFFASAEVVPFRNSARLDDAAQLLSPSAIHIDGWLGTRIEVNATNRLLTIDTEPLLAGFRKKPGIHPWIGEHVGKWMHAATLAWAYTADVRLREKLDKTASELIAAQEPDGYLGTYIPEKRFGLYPEADWDVWSHKYNLLGLLTYYQFTANEPALTASRKIGDLLINTFGPGKKSILSAGTHVGMASTSVLEPVVLLYRFTADERYLEFAKYIVKSWDEPDGPHILETLSTLKQVNKTANGKAYEMLSNLVGLCELARATGDRQYLQPVLNAWEDIVTRRLYITGSASQGEHFHDDYDLPNKPGAAVAETCVTTTWIQLNLQLLRLTGHAKFGTELERTLYNHLAAAQNPRGDDWCYFTPLEGLKEYTSGINCCHSSGPRGMALAPLSAYLRGRVGDSDALLVNSFENSRAELALDGTTVKVEQQSGFPAEGESELRITAPNSARFAIAIRSVEWGKPLEIRLNDTKLDSEVRDGWAIIPARKWKQGDHISLRFPLQPRLVMGEHGNAGLAALQWGPFVMAYDAAYNPDLPNSSLLQFAMAGEAKLLDSSGPALKVRFNVRSPRFPDVRPAIFVPFADAGAGKQLFKVWLASPDARLSDIPNLRPDGSLSLFDGSTFAGWEGDTNKTWRIENHEIVGGSLASNVPQNEFLCTTRPFTNFVLKLKFKLIGKSGFINAGVQFRSRRVQEPPNEMAGYQADMGDPDYWGCIYDEGIRNKIIAKSDMEKLDKILKRNDWNEYVIRAEGRRVRLSINGLQTVDFTEPEEQRAQWGVIGLQIHGGAVAEVRYKDVMIEERN